VSGVIGFLVFLVGGLLVTLAAIVSVFVAFFTCDHDWWVP
jgi:hypothetical protein